MKRSFSIILGLVMISLSGFVKEPISYEQITFDYFVSDILRNDFKDIASFEFKGKTEESYSALGKYKFCLKPEERLGAIMENATRNFTIKAKEISYEHIKGLTILDFKSKVSGARLYVYPSLHIADNYYVFLSFEKPKEQVAKYVFELAPDGNISRSCRMN
jgi:hypothetical protein